MIRRQFAEICDHLWLRLTVVSNLVSHRKPSFLQQKTCDEWDYEFKLPYA